MLEKSDSASSQAFRRSLELYRFALTNHARLQEDIARGAGSHLETFAWLVGNGDEAAARLVSAAILDHSAALLPAPTAPEFVRQFDRMLAEEAGVGRAITIIRDELDVSMALCGLTSVHEIGPQVIAQA